MKRFLLQMLPMFLAATAFCAGPAPRPLPLERANALPLALDDAFQFRKTISFLNDTRIEKQATHPMINFERQRINFGAVTQYERMQRWGHYYTFFWRADRPAALTVRFEYRQEKLGSLVQAKEIHYDNAKGSMQTAFQVIGDDYNEEGKVTSWRVVLIQGGKIVALNQSFLWN